MIHRVVIAFAAAFLLHNVVLVCRRSFCERHSALSIEQGPRVGFMREIVSEIARRTGTQVPIVYGKSWPQSQEEAKTRPDTLIFPLARTAAREPHYQWVQKVLDMDVAFATAPGKPRVKAMLPHAL